MPFTTESRWWPELVDQMGIFVPSLGADQQRVFLRQHFREADDGIERRAQLVAHGGEEVALGGVRALGLGAGVLDRLLLRLALGGVAHDRHDLAVMAVVALADGERTAAHLDPDELGGGRGRAFGGVAAHAELCGAILAVRGRVGQRREIGGTVGDVDPVEQAAPEQILHLGAEQRFGRR